MPTTMPNKTPSTIQQNSMFATRPRGPSTAGLSGLGASKASDWEASYRGDSDDEDNDVFYDAQGGGDSVRGGDAGDDEQLADQGLLDRLALSLAGNMDTGTATPQERRKSKAKDRVNVQLW